MWWLLFGAIVLFALVLYALLGRWLWRKARALFVELDEATERLEAAGALLEAAETGRHRDPTVRRSSGRGRISA